MFWKKDKEENPDQYAAIKVALEIAVRRMVGVSIQNSKEGQILALICAGVRAAEGDQYDDVVVEVMDEYTDWFEEDPLLKADIKSILQLMGLGDVPVDIPKVDAVLDTVCALV